MEFQILFVSNLVFYIFFLNTVFFNLFYQGPLHVATQRANTEIVRLLLLCDQLNTLLPCVSKIIFFFIKFQMLFLVLFN